MFGRWPSSAASSGSAEARRGQGQVEGGEVLDREVPACRPAAAATARSLAGAEDAAAVPGRFGADHGAGEERGATAAGEQDADLRRRAAGERPRLGALEQDMAVFRRRPGPLPEQVGGGGGDPLEVVRRLAVPGGAAGDHVVEPFQRPVREGVEVDRAVGVAGVEGLLRVGRDGRVGELDQRHVGVRPEQLVGGVAVLPRVEHRLAVHHRQERLQLAPVPRRPDRRIPQRQEARVDRPADEQTASTAQPTARARGPRQTARSRLPGMRSKLSARRTRRAAGGSPPASPAAPRSSAPWPGSSRRWRGGRRGRGGRRRRARRDRQLAAAHPPGDARQQRQDRDRPGQAGQRAPPAASRR